MPDIRWIKVAVDMFEDSKIEFIRSLPEGDSIIVTWIQMMSIAGQSNMGGYLMVTNDIPYTEQLLSTKLRRSPVFMQFALETLQKLKMVNVEDGPYHITNWEKHQNIDGMEKVRLQNRERKRLQREREKQILLSPVSRDKSRDVTIENEPIVTRSHDTEVEVEIDINTTTTDGFEIVRIAYREMHGVIDLPYDDSPTLSHLLAEGIPPELIIQVMKEKKKPGIKTIKYYVDAIKERHNGIPPHKRITRQEREMDILKRFAAEGDAG